MCAAAAAAYRLLARVMLVRVWLAVSIEAMKVAEAIPRPAEDTSATSFGSERGEGRGRDVSGAAAAVAKAPGSARRRAPG